MTPEASRPQLSAHRILFHDLLACSALVLWLVAVTPPVLTWSGQYEFVQATQFCLFAIVIPALLVVGGPWRWLRLTANEPFSVDVDGRRISPANPRLLDRWAQSRTLNSGYRRVVLLLIVFVAQVILWRTAPVVDALVRHPWISVIESLTLVVGGSFLWLELVESAPFRPTTPRPYRIGVSAIAMWSVWVIAYLMAMAQNSWYSGFRHVSGRLFSLAMDQQVTTGLMWFISASAFMPIIFANLSRWLQSEEDPDEELYQLVRRDRSRGFFGTNP
jgi:cytochrome c oxidase assembly factor CtaG